MTHCVETSQAGASVGVETTCDRELFIRQIGRKPKKRIEANGRKRYPKYAARAAIGEQCQEPRARSRCGRSNAISPAINRTIAGKRNSHLRETVK